MTKCTHEREDFSEFERGEEAWLVSVFFWHADFYFIWDRISIRKCMHGLSAEVVRRSHSSAPKSQFRGQGIHTAISLRDLRDASLENTSRPSFELCNSNYPSWWSFRYSIWAKILSLEWSVTPMIIQISHLCSRVKPSEPSINIYGIFFSILSHPKLSSHVSISLLMCHPKFYVVL